MEARQETKLKRTLGFGDLMGIAIGQIIGAGIMSSTGIAIGMTGTGVVLAYAIAPALTLLCIYPLVMLGSAAPTVGGQYRYASRLLGKDAGTFYIVLYIFTNCFISVYALSFSAYFCSMVPGANPRITALAVMTFFFITNLIGTKTAARVGRSTTFVLIGGLLLFAVFGIPKADFSYVFAKENLFTNGASGFMGTLALLYSALVGGQCVVDLGGETKDPGKNIPRVIITSTLAVGVLYVLVSYAAAGVLPMEETANETLALVARETMPAPVFYLFMIGAALSATASAINSQFSWVTKPLLVACEDGIFPKRMGSVSERGVPYKCLIFFYLVNAVPIALGFDIATMQKFVTANSLITKLFLAAALIRFIRRYPGQLGRGPLPLSDKMSLALTGLSIVVILVLSVSMLINLSVSACIFVGSALALSLLYSRTVLRRTTIPDDLF